MNLLSVRGRESKTYKFVFIAYWVVTIKFALAGLSHTDGQWSFVFSFTGATEYGMAIGAILLIWLGREWTEKVSAKGESHG